MSAEIRNDNRSKIKAELRDALAKALDESGKVVRDIAKANAPYRTGNLYRSITSKMNGETEVQIGSDVEYAAYVELGTSRMKAKPYLKRAADDNRDQIGAIFEKYLK